MRVSSAISNSNRQIGSLFVAGLAIVVAPGLWFDAPYSWDFFNHVARLSVLAAQPDNPVLRFYEVHWALIPNLGMDALFYVVSGLLSPEIFMRAIWCASILSIAAAVWFLNVTLHGRPQVTLLFVPLLSYNLVITAGLFNFALGTALGLATIALWIRLRGIPVGLRLATFNALAALLFFSHLVAFVAVLLVVIWIEMFPRLALPGWAAIRRGAVVPAFFVAGLVLFLISVPLESRFVSSSQKLGIVLSPFLSTVISADIIAILFVLTALSILYLGRGSTVAPAMRTALLLFALMVIVAPSSFGPGSFIDARLAVFGTMLLIASSANMATRGTRLFILVAGTGVLLRVAMVLPTWGGYEADVRSFREALKSIPPGSAVLIANEDSTGCATMEIAAQQHMAALAVSDRQSFANIMFTGRGMQPVQIRSEAESLAQLWQALSPDELKGVRNLGAVASAPYYDHLVSFHFPCTTSPPVSAGLIPIGQTRVATIYRVGQSKP